MFDGNLKGWLTERLRKESVVIDLFVRNGVQVARIAPHFPFAYGVPGVDDRGVDSGIVYIIKRGLQWKDAPNGYGRYKTL